MPKYVISVLISILSSSVISIVLSILIFDPFREKKKYIFDEKNVYMIRL